MAEVYRIRNKKSYASDVIKDLCKMEAVELLEEPPIPEWQKDEVRKRIKKYNEHPELLIDGDKALEMINNM